MAKTLVSTNNQSWYLLVGKANIKLFTITFCLINQEMVIKIEGNAL